METATLRLANLDSTEKLAGTLVSALDQGQFLALSGDLGAGKTTFTRMLTEALGCETLATSPTFSLFQVYEGGRMPVFHADLYRVGSEDELFDLGWDETLDDFRDGLAVVEWSNKFVQSLPGDRLEIKCEHGVHDDERVFEFIALGARSSRLLARLRESELRFE